MKNSKIIVVSITIFVIVLTGIWSWRMREDSPSSSPTESQLNTSDVIAKDENTGNEPIAKVDSSEWARHQIAGKGNSDIESVVRTFKEANDCLHYHVARNEINSMLNDKRLDDLSDETLATLEDIDAISSKRLSVVRKLEAFCSGSDREALVDAYTDAILEAALRGNPDAQSCFVIGSVFPQDKMKSASSAEALVRRYVKYAPIFTKNALESDDPHVAAKALRKYVATPSWHPSELDEIPKAEPYLTWRVARLASLRALPDQRARLEYDLAEFRKQNILSTDEIKRADASAMAAYERNFSRQPPIDVDSLTSCYSSPDLAP